MHRWEVSTGRLIVREPRRRDAVALASAYDPAAMAAHGWTRTIRRRTLMGIARGQARGALLVVGNGDGRPIGTVHVDLNRRPPSTGLIMGPDGRGQGLGLEAMRAALPYFAERGSSELILETDVGNKAMRRIVEQLGAVVMTEYVHTLPNGEQRPAVRYALPPQPATGGTKE